VNTSTAELDLTSETAVFYGRALEILTQAGVSFLVGGAFALHPYAGLARDTKDFDIFVRPWDRDHVLRVFAKAGFRTEVTFEHWLAKAWCCDSFVDVIYSSGNGIAEVDDEWFAHARAGQILGYAVKLCPPEETIWSKAFIMERERYDGADIAHLLRSAARELDWQRLIQRFGDDWRVLFSHLILFGYVYPNERDAVPEWVLFQMTRRMLAEMESDPDPTLVCRGTLLSRAQYLTDIEEWGYQDARIIPGSATMSPDQADAWTEAASDRPVS
jgi:hypothetical protein